MRWTPGYSPRTETWRKRCLRVTVTGRPGSMVRVVSLNTVGRRVPRPGVAYQVIHGDPHGVLGG